MKKLVAISVLFAGLATAVFAQSGGWSNEWKLGLSARFNTDMFITTHASGKSEATQDTTPVTPSSFADDGTNTWSKESGKYDKGRTHFFPNSSTLTLPDSRVFLSLANSGENYDIYFTVTTDNWTKENGGKGASLMQFLSGIPEEDWGIRATPGIFSMTIGGKYAPEGRVNGNAFWGSYLGYNQTYPFGVYRYDTSKGSNGINYHSNRFGNLDQWGNPFSVGMTLGDDFKFVLGYRINPNWGNWAAANDNKSTINGSFLFSGSPGGVIDFDLFYAIRGTDKENFSRPGSPSDSHFGYNDPQGSWQNILGAYIGIKGIENLVLSVGYTASFNVYEVGGYLCSDADFTQSKPVTYNAPIYSGIDLRLGYSGIEKIGLKFNNNVSFAGVNGDKVAEDTSATRDLHQFVYKEKINLLLNEKTVLAATDKNAGDGLTQNWFHWQSMLQAKLGFIDGVDLEVGFMNGLGVLTEKLNKSENTPLLAPTDTVKSERTTTTTKNEFRATVGATYGVGNATVGVALFLQLNSTLINEEKTVTTSPFAGGTPVVVKTTLKSNDDVVKFGIPIYFRVSF